MSASRAVIPIAARPHSTPVAILRRLGSKIALEPQKHHHALAQFQKPPLQLSSFRLELAELATIYLVAVRAPI